MASTERGRMQKAIAVGLWVLIVFEMQIGLTGVGKLGSGQWQAWFEGWGYAPWFVVSIGVAEIGGAVMLLVKKLASYAAMLLIAIMVGALWTVTTKESQLGPDGPIIHLVGLSLLLWGRWKHRWRPESTQGARAVV